MSSPDADDDTTIKKPLIDGKDNVDAHQPQPQPQSHNNNFDDNNNHQSAASSSPAQWILSQTQINKEIISMINSSKTTLTFISMMSQHSNPTLITAIQNAISRGVDVRIYHNANPYVPAPPKTTATTTTYPLHIISMHGTTLFSYLSLMIGQYVSPFRTNVTHTRFIVNDTHAMFGGCDYNIVCESDDYVQHTVKVSVNDDIRRVVTALRMGNSLRDYSYSSAASRQGSTSSSGSSSSTTLIGTSDVDTSARDVILEAIHRAESRIFIENQYFEHEGILSAIADRQLNHRPNLRITLVGNINFEINPYHPGLPGGWLLSSLTGKLLRYETRKGLAILKRKNCSFDFRTYKACYRAYNKKGSSKDLYTHNKVFIIDDWVAVGTFNCHKRSLMKGNDVEIGIVFNGGEKEGVDRLAEEYIEVAMERTVPLEEDCGSRGDVVCG